MALGGLRSAAQGRFSSQGGEGRGAGWKREYAPWFPAGETILTERKIAFSKCAPSRPRGNPSAENAPGQAWSRSASPCRSVCGWRGREESQVVPAWNDIWRSRPPRARASATQIELPIALIIASAPGARPGRTMPGQSEPGV